ncbi:MAG: hypothetical protein WCB68_00580 [Pyrinomonadaceae bacterium]
MILYADPGSGAMIWQLLLAFFFGATFYFSRLKGWLRSRVGEKKDAKPASDTNYSIETLSSNTEAE